MLVRLKNGNVENLSAHRANIFIKLGYASKYVPLAKDAVLLKAEEQGGAAACAAVELAVYEPKAERAVLTYARTSRSQRAR